MRNKNSNDYGLSGHDDSKESEVEDSFLKRVGLFVGDLIRTFEIIRNTFFSGIIGAILATIAIRPKSTPDDIMWLMFWFISAVIGTVIGFIGMIVASNQERFYIKESYVPWVGYLLSAITSFTTILIFYFTA